jgi:glucan-binding YG repeat protein
MLTGWQQWKDEWYYLDTTEGSTLGQCWHEKNGGSGVLEPWYVE